jgi:hypothetical protein
MSVPTSTSLGTESEPAKAAEDLKAVIRATLFGEAKMED